MYKVNIFQVLQNIESASLQEQMQRIFFKAKQLGLTIHNKGINEENSSRCTKKGETDLFMQHIKIIYFNLVTALTTLHHTQDPITR